MFRLGGIQIFPTVLSYKECFGFRVVNDVENYIRSEVGQDRYNDSSMCQNTKESDGPVTGVTS